MKLSLKHMGASLRQLREEAGLSQFDLAQRLGISYQAVQRIESGRNGANVRTLERFAKALGLMLAIEMREQK